MAGLERQYADHLEPVLGPLIGHSSDGDSRRRKLQVQLMTCTARERYRPISEELGFIFSARKESNPTDQTEYVIRDLGDQDVIHIHKKAVNHLDHARQMIHIGPILLVHLNHVERVVNEFPEMQHGLTRGHVRRHRDRQNWKIAQELCFQKVINCLQCIVDGHVNKPDISVKGTRAFLYLINEYVDVFFSLSLSLTKRIECAGFVTHFLGIWRNFIYKHTDLLLSRNFLSRETYTDLLISTHLSVILICFNRDNFPKEVSFEQKWFRLL